jgi:hypothetical protein
MKCAVEGDHLLTAGVIAGQLEGALDGLGTGVAVEDAVRAGHGGDGGDPGSQVGEMLVVEVSAGDVDQFGGLLLDGGDDLRVAVAGGGNGDTGGKVEKFIAIHVFHTDAAAALGD